MKYIIILYVFLVTIEPVRSQISLDSTVLYTTELISDLDIPWEIIYGPDNKLWVTERFGRVSRIDPVTGDQQVVLDISSQVIDAGESGLLGMVLHPDFSNTPEVFLVYTYLSSGKIKERLVKYIFDGNTLINPNILLDSLKGDNTHDGSRLIITIDGKLFMTTGDAQDQSTPQNLQSLNGKVLRLNLDGSVPADNPKPSSPVWTSGHRNPQGLVQHPSGKIFISEHGTSIDDEFNVIIKGENYGWPEIEGYCDLPDEIQFCMDSAVVEPLMSWTPTIAPSDLLWYDSDEIPEWESSFLMVTLKDQKLVRIKMDNALSMVTDTISYLRKEFGRLRDICTDPWGNIYLATNGDSWLNSNPFTHKIIKLTTSPVSGIREVWDNMFSVSVDNRKLIIKSLAEQENRTFRIMDISGKEITKGTISGKYLKVNFNKPKGVYLLSIDSYKLIKFLNY